MQQQANTRIGFLRSIQGRMIIWFLILGLLPVSILGVLAYTSAESALRESIQDGLEAVVAAKTLRLQDWLADSGRMAQMVATLPTVMGSEDEHLNVGLEILADAEDEAARQDAYNAAHEAIEVVRASYQRVDDISLIALDGTVILSTDAAFEGSNVASADYFINGQTGMYQSDAMPNAEDDTNLDIMVAAPVYTLDGTLIGVAALEVNTSTIQTMMGDYTGLGETGETYVVDTHRGMMVTQSRFVTDESTLLNPDYVIDTYAVQQAEAGVESGRADYQDYRGADIVGSWQAIEGTDWLMLGEIDAEEAYTPVYDLGLLTLIIVGGAAILLAAAAYLVSRTLAGPVMRVTDVAVRIADGQLNQRANIRSNDEIGVLARAFNRMTDNLQNMMETERDSKARLEATVTEYMDFVQQVADGNLTVQLNLNGNGHQANQDENLVRLGDNLNSMVANLRQMTMQMRDMATNLASAAAEILAATTQQMSSTTEQDATVTQTMTTVEEIVATVRQTADRAQSVADASQQSVQVSLAGQDAVTDSMDGMGVIRERVEDIAETILALSARTQQISEIINTVNEIADQSKLLALNASIEAARAGEEGKGFAVVAMEVRQLAEQSREATARVGDILNEIQQATNTAVMVTEEGSKGTEAGMQLVERAGAAIRELATTIEEAAQVAQQIAASTQQQTNGMDQLTAAITSIKQASTQSASSTRQAEKSAQDLNQMAREMEQTVARYQV